MRINLTPGLPRILGINGIRTDGSASTDKLLSRLNISGFATVDINYPRVNIFTARSRKRQLRNAQYLVDMHQPGDVLIAHSYGCLLALRAMELGARFSAVFFFAPALNKDFTFPYLGCNSLHVIHNENDKAIRLGEFLIGHDFGAMGRVGYQGPPDPRIVNMLNTDSNDELNHSHYFLDKYIRQYADLVESIVSISSEGS